MEAAEYRDESSNEALDLVKAEVGIDGLPTRLTIDPKAMKLTARELADLVLAAVRRAHRSKVQQLLQRADQMPTLVSPQLQVVNAATESAHDQVIRASRAAAEQADAIRRAISEIVEM